LERPALGLVCSVQCPGSVILKLYDAIRVLRDAGVTVVGGFHSPMERECLDLLLRGVQPIIIATTARRSRIPANWKAAIGQQRVAVITPSETTARRTTTALAERRNQLVAGVATVLFVPYVSPGGKTEALATATIASGKTVITLDDPANAALIATGAIPVDARNAAEAAALVTGRGMKEVLK
jgi:hypothetical protein